MKPYFILSRQEGPLPCIEPWGTGILASARAAWEVW
jgi:hypothetical protein